MGKGSNRSCTLLALLFFVIPLHAADIAQAKAAWRHCRRCAHSHSSTAKCSLCSGRCRTVRHRRVHCPPCVPSRNTSVRKGDANASHCAPRTLRLCTDSQGVCPAPSTPAESRAALKKTQTSSRPSPSITNRTRRTPVRRDGGARQATSGMSQGYRAGSQDSLVFLRSMVARALAYSPELRAASAEVMASDYMVDQVKASACPRYVWA